MNLQQSGSSTKQWATEPGRDDDTKSTVPFIGLGFAALSSILPGAGQILAGYRWRGTILLGITALLAFPGLYFYQQGTSTLLSYAVQPRILVAIFVINLSLLVFRLGVVIDAFRLRGTTGASNIPSWQKASIVVLLVVLLAITAAPHLVVAYYTYLTHDLLTDVFSTELTVDDIPTPAPIPSPTPTSGP